VGGVWDGDELIATSVCIETNGVEDAVEIASLSAKPIMNQLGNNRSSQSQQRSVFFSILRVCALGFLHALPTFLSVLPACVYLSLSIAHSERLQRGPAEGEMGKRRRGLRDRTSRQVSTGDGWASDIARCVPAPALTESWTSRPSGRSGPVCLPPSVRVTVRLGLASNRGCLRHLADPPGPVVTRTRGVGDSMAA
jgi:hypothetical protein